MISCTTDFHNIPLLRGVRGVLESISMGMFASINVVCLTHPLTPSQEGSFFISSRSFLPLVVWMTMRKNERIKPPWTSVYSVVNLK